MRGRITTTLVAAMAGAAMILVPSGPVQAADRPLPISTGPNGAERGPSGASARIVGGKPVADGAYPFQAALLIESRGENDRQRQYCGGSLIAQRYVLTAAHCVFFFIGDGPDQFPLTDLRVVVGRTVLTSDQGERREVTAVQVHPQFDPETFAYDVAVLRLSAPVTNVRPVLLATPGTDALERPGTRATITGWGNTIAQPAGPGSGGLNLPDRMEEAKVPIVSRPECRTAYAPAGLTIAESMLCAGLTNRDTCQGDSGGPLFFKVTGSDDHIQVGVTSWGIGCGATGFPGVYARLGNEEVGDFILAATGGVPVTAAPADAARAASV